MLTRWSDLDQTFALMEEFQRRVHQVFADLQSTGPAGASRQIEGYRRPSLGWSARGTWPLVNLYDRDDALVLTALVPGLTDKEIQLTANQDVLTISGERRSTGPEGYSVHRQERGDVSFSRSFTLPCKCDIERTSATVKNGVLMITLAKAPEAKPRQISVTTR